MAMEKIYIKRLSQFLLSDFYGHMNQAEVFWDLCENYLAIDSWRGCQSS